MPETNRYTIMHDEELMSGICRGEVGAFDELYHRYSRPLMAYFRRMLNFNANLAEDAFQDLFLQIAEFPDKFDRKRSFRTWIYVIASNNCKNYYRHLKVVQKSRDEILHTRESSDDRLFSGLASRMDAVKFRDSLNDVLNSLSYEKKEAFLLKYQEEKSIAEIAAIQDCPEGSVKSRLHYTVKVLESKLFAFNPLI